MIWQRVRGHHDQVEMFRRAIRRNRLSHAFLFEGPHGIGKKRFARTLAQCLFCRAFPDEQLQACGECASCRQMLAGTHPDYLEVGCPPGKAELPIELIAGKRDHRGREGLRYELSLRPMAGERKIAVVDDAELFNAESANALLKTLEEPPAYSLLLLLVDDAETLLPTIRSRCQRVRFAPLSDLDVAELLLEQGRVESASEAESLARLSGGSLETAAQLLTPQIGELRHAVTEAFSQDDFHTGEIGGRIVSIIDACGDTPAQRQAARWAVRFCAEACARRLQQDGPPQRLEAAAAQIERAADAVRQLESNAQISHWLQALIDDVNRLGRAANV